MSVRQKPKLGDVVEILLPRGGVAYGRVLRDASIAVYRRVEDQALPPIGSRDYLFVVGIYEDALSNLPIVGHDPSASSDEDWPPPYCVTDKITGGKSIYHRGEMTAAADAEACAGLEPAAVWDLHHLADRIEAAHAPRE